MYTFASGGYTMKFKRIITIVLIVLLLLTGLVIAVPFIFRDDIVKIIKTEINDQVNANVDFDKNVSIGIIQSFPSLSVEIENLVITGLDKFAGDTLLYAGSIKTSINLRDLIKSNKATINGLELKSTYINLIARDSFYNWDITKPTEDTTSSVAMSADFKKIILEDTRFRYADEVGDIVVDVKDIDGAVTGNFIENVFDATTNFSTSDALISYEGIPYVNHLPVRADAVILSDIENFIFTFKDNELYTGELNLSLNGDLKFTENDDIDYNLEFASNKAEMKEFLSLIPDLYRTDLKDFETKGKMAFSGYFKGVYSDTEFPAYQLKLLIEDGFLRYSKIADALSSIHLNINVENPDGIDDHLVVNLSDLSFSLKNEPFKTQLLVKTPVSDPYMKGFVKGKIHLKDFAEFLPQDLGLSMKGDVAADVTFDGNYSAAKNEDFNRFSSTGIIKASELEYKSTDLPNPIDIPVAEVSFNKSEVSVPTLKIQSGKSDLLLGGKLRNFFGYLLNGETLAGDLRLASEQFRDQDFVKPEPVTSNATASETAAFSTADALIPKNIQLNFDGNINHLEYGGRTFDMAVLNANTQNGIVNIDQLSTQFMGGHLSLSGAYNTSDPKNVTTDLSLTAREFDIATIFKSFETVRLLAPIAEYAKGKFSTTFKVNTKLLEDFSPDLSAIDCSGILDLFDCDLKGLKVMNVLGDKLKNDNFSKPLKLKDLLLSFSIEDGTVHLNPFEIPVGDTKLNIEGSTALDKTISFKGLLTVPKELYEANAQTYQSLIPKNKLTELATGDFNDLLFNIDILGTFLKPEVKLNFQNLKKGLKDQIKDQVKNEIDLRKKEAEDKARAEMEKARIEAEKAKQQAEDAAKKAIEEEKRKAEERIKQEQEAAKEAAKKKLEEELKKKTGIIKPK
ncbi:MAG: hypothetical protein GC181_04830 [Bacteroidetes bacterium]|nr:hypothetical protein [Bacteroidota bacterium]